MKQSVMHIINKVRGQRPMSPVQLKLLILVFCAPIFLHLDIFCSDSAFIFAWHSSLSFSILYLVRRYKSVTFDLMSSDPASLCGLMITLPTFLRSCIRAIALPISSNAHTESMTGLTLPWV